MQESSFTPDLVREAVGGNQALARRMIGSEPSRSCCTVRNWQSQWGNVRDKSCWTVTAFMPLLRNWQPKFFGWQGVKWLGPVRNQRTYRALNADQKISYFPYTVRQALSEIKA